MVPIFKAQTDDPSAARTAVDQVADTLRRGITTGEYQPNERLVEESLAQVNGTNRAVVRQVLARLELEGLVVRERNRGARVRSVNAEEAAEILEVRAALEGVVARRAAERIDASGLERLTAIVTEMQAHQRAGDLPAYSQCNARFHRAILEIAEHVTASKLLAMLQSQSVRYQFRTVLHPGRASHSLAEHEAILQALVDRDPDAAERAAIAHVRNVKETVKAVASMHL